MAPKSKTLKTPKKKAPRKSKPQTAQSPNEKDAPLSLTTIKKQYLKTRNTCKVSFRLPGHAAVDAHQVCIVGDFNGWREDAHPMKKLKNGDFTINLDLEPGREYQYRYLIDNERWENDWNADAYKTSPFGDSENSVVKI